MPTTAADSRMDAPVIAFYAPLKPPTHPNPSGDRLLARLLIQALQQAGFDPQLASIFRSYDRDGDRQRQQRIKAIAERLAQRLIRHYQRLPAERRPKLWFSYHLYHKAPDWIGPIVSRALQIPYVVAEASYAAKQHTGAWQLGLAGSVEALQHAALILCLNPADHGGIEQCRAEPPLQSLPPFLDLTPYLPPPSSQTTQVNRHRLAQRYALNPDHPWLICVAMMRPGDKLSSYQLLARSLQPLTGAPWHLIVVGDGSARADVSAAFDPISDQVCFTGQLPPEAIRELLQASNLYLWPAVNEAFGMALLEAQAAGTPVLAGDEGGVRSIIHDNGGWLVTGRDSDAFCAKLTQLLQQHEQQQQPFAQAGTNARNYIEQQHSLEAAGLRLQQLLLPLMRSHASNPQGTDDD